MKANKLLLAALAFASLATLSLAGPSPQFANRPAKAPAVETPKNTAACSSCACCADPKKA
jgi:hypothetical protein